MELYFIWIREVGIYGDDARMYPYDMAPCEYCDVFIFDSIEAAKQRIDVLRKRHNYDYMDKNYLADIKYSIGVMTKDPEIGGWNIGNLEF